MKTLVFALGLRVIRTSVADLDAEAHEPCHQLGKPVLGVAAPGRAIIAEDAPGQAVAAEGPLQLRLHSLGLLVRASSEADQEARVVIQDRESEAGTGIGLDRALEVHLPE